MIRELSVFLIVAGIVTMESAEPKSEALIAGTLPLVQGNTRLALEIFTQVKRPQENVFFSPYSISTCLGMAYLGARGDTAAQMAQTLHFDTNQSHLAASFNQLQGQLAAAGQKSGIQLTSANGIWAQPGHPFLPGFLDAAKESFSARIVPADFRTQAEAKRVEINTWVEETTRGKISDLIPPGAVDAATRMVLVNAIYFKGMWAHPFAKADTKEAPFKTGPAQSIQVPTMSRTATFKYAQIEHGQVLEIPYQGGDLSMFVILPAEVDGLERLESSLTSTNLERWLGQSPEREVQVFLPKFTLTGKFFLSDALKQLGMKAAFSAQADFSGMDGIRDLLISTVIHKAFVDVNEEGTEAAAATGTVMRLTAMPIRPIFRADHPFLFLIRDTHSGSILFMGRVSNPLSK